MEYAKASGKPAPILKYAVEADEEDEEVDDGRYEEPTTTVPSAAVTE
jgi:hypothetical protein